MITIQVNGRITPQGKLEVDLPDGLPPGDVRITIELASVQDTGRRLSARELLKLPPEERARILQDAARQAEEDYRTDPGLTCFDAFGDKTTSPL